MHTRISHTRAFASPVATMELIQCPDWRSFLPKQDRIVLRKTPSTKSFEESVSLAIDASEKIAQKAATKHPCVSLAKTTLPQPAGGCETYTIWAGDPLERIARRKLGGGQRYRELYEANKDQIKSVSALKIGTVITIPSEASSLGAVLFNWGRVGAVIVALSILPKDTPQYTWNFTNSVDRGIYKRIEEQDVELRLFYNDPVCVNFCLPVSLRRASFYERYCSSDHPTRTMNLKRVAGKQSTEHAGWVVRGDTNGSLDSRLLGPVHDYQIRGFWRPYFIWSSSVEN